MASRRADRFQPDQAPPGTSAELAAYLRREFERLAVLLERPRLTETFVEPSKPEPYVLLLADGTSWNPGFGRGVYFWDPSLSDWYLVA